MKARRALLLFALVTVPAHALAPRHTYRTAAELQGFGDFNGDSRLDVVVIDRPTGACRIGHQQADGSLVWQAALPGGVPAAESFASGPILQPGADQLAITGTSANAVHLLDPAAATTVIRPTRLVPNGLGPVSVGAFDFPGAAGNDPTRLDLAVLTGWNNAPNPHRRHLLQSLAGGISPLADANLSGPADRGGRVLLLDAGPERYAHLLRGGTNDTFRVFDTAAPGLPVLTSATGLPAGCDFVHGPFAGNGRHQFVFWTFGGTALTTVATDAGGALPAPAVHTLGSDPITGVFLTNTGTTTGILVVFNAGTSAAFYTLGAGGAVTLVQPLTPPAGSTIGGLLAYRPGRHSLLLAGPGGGASVRMQDLQHDGSSWIPGAITPLPGTGSRTGLTNVLIYQNEPLVDENAVLVETLQVPDWSSSFSVDGSGQITVVAEAFGTAADGLDNPSPVAVGGSPVAAGDTFGVVNQPASAFSVDSGQTVFGVVPPPVAIEPPPGTLRRHTTLRLTSTDSTVSAFYRFDGSGTWTPFTIGTDAITPPGSTLRPFTVFYYAEKGGARSPIHRADYTWAGEPGTLDSDGDGVPDFVELANGLDPTAGDDSDGDGFSDLAELLDGSDPDDSSSKPATARPDLQAAFNIAVQPLSHNGTPGAAPSALSYAAGDPSWQPTALRAHAPGGSLFAQSETSTLGLGTPGDPAALLEKIPGGEPDLFTVVSTAATFDVQPALTGFGRELAVLVPNPTLAAGGVDFTYDGTSAPATAAAAWLAAAQAHYGALTRETLATTLDLDDTLKLFLFERALKSLLRLRDPAHPDAPVSLTGFRDPVKPLAAGDPARTATTPLLVSSDSLRALQQYVSPSNPGWRLHSLWETIDDLVETSTDPGLLALRKLANDIYRLSATGAAANPGLYPSPFDTLRSVVSSLPAVAGNIDGAIPLPGDPPVGSPDPATSYSGGHSLSPAELTAADGAFVWLRQQLPGRPTASYTATVTNDTFDGPVPTVDDDATSNTLALYDADGDPFRFPDEIALPVGSKMEILAFTDRTDLSGHGGTALEVIEATLTEIPTPATADANGNAVDDAWELFFFGTSCDPFDDDDGDGYINLQEALENTHPREAGSSPAGPPLPTRPPQVRITRQGGMLRLEVDFPSRYAGQIALVLQRSDNLIVPFTEVAGSEAADEGNDTYALEFPQPAANRRFYRFRLVLR